MPSQKNITQVQELSDKLSRAKVVILTDYSGLSVNLQQKLRQDIANAGGQFVVAKNTLFNSRIQKRGKPVYPVTSKTFCGAPPPSCLPSMMKLHPSTPW